MLRTVVDRDEIAARRRAALWSALAGATQLAIPFAGPVFYPFLYDLLVAIGYGLVLPAVAVLHVRNRQMRASGAVLGSLAGTAAVTVGLAASVNVDLRPAALFVVGVWWWTVGKMAAQTGSLPRGFGVATAALGALAFVAVVLVDAASPMHTFAQLPDLPVWSAAEIALGAWLVALAGILARV